MIICAIETAMRRSELLRLKWDNINFDTKQALLPITKNGRSRWIPLSSLMIATLETVPRSSDHVFSITV